MRHDAHGHWIAEVGSPPELAPLEGDAEADVVIVGGGYTGLWTAWHVLAAAPDARVVILESGRCGHGPSGRNGGFVSSLDLSLPSLTADYGAPAARAWVDAAAETVDAVGAWCESEGVDAWYLRAGELCVSTAPAQDGVSADAVDGRNVVALSAAEARARCDSPVFRGGVLVPRTATVHPARLAFGLRERLLARGARIHEGSRAAGIGPATGGVAVRTARGRVRARTAVLAINAATGTLAPLRNRLTVSSSHIVCTEPVPDVLDELGWRGGESISDGRALLHYMRTTRDDRIVFGWAGGRMAAGARPGGRMEIDGPIVEQVRADLLRFFPQLEGRRMAHAWGGPIDVSPTHRPAIVGLRGLAAWAAFGYTGNGVGPSHLFGRTLAALSLDRRDPVTRLPFVEPEPSTSRPSRSASPAPRSSAGRSCARRPRRRRTAGRTRSRPASPRYPDCSGSIS